ncbi:alpha tubulin suppressor [Marasmius crinis-equi]|uniref:Alpha tubulin suppressor n=1 Tax=Marasmius crinis-equi TaxID=585013 RepID=A0ABR3G055_9AGAR
MVVNLYACGSNAQGQLANGSKEDYHSFERCILPDSVELWDISQLACGGNHTLLLAQIVDESGNEPRLQLYGCGDGSVGQLGCPGDSPSLRFRRIDLQLGRHGLEKYQPRLICASWQTTYVVLSCLEKPDRLISMGSDDFGDLGTGGLQQTSSATSEVPFHAVTFSHLAVNGVRLDDTGYFTVKAIAAGQHRIIVHLHARLIDGSYRHLTVGWGTCRHGELGPVEELSPKGRRKSVTFFSAPKIIFVDDDIASLALGNQHSVFRRVSGALTGIGSNKKNQLHDLDTIASAGVGCTWNGTYVIHGQDQEVYATGNHAKGQLGRQLSSDSAQPHLDRVEFPFSSSRSYQLISMACGSEHVLTLWKTPGDDGREVWGWGWNEHGNLGVGSTQDVTLPVKIWPQEANENSNSTRVLGVWAGCGTSWIAAECS